MTKSKIFLYFCLSFVFGVFFASLIKIPFVIIGSFFVFGLILASVFWSKNKIAVVAGFCLLIFALGILRYWQKDQMSDLARFNDKGFLTLKGRVAEVPEISKNYQKIKIEAQEVVVGGKKIKTAGLTLATGELYPEYKFGDILEIIGRLEEPKNLSGGFDYKNYLAKSDIYSVVNYPSIKILAVNQGGKIKQALFWLRHKFENSIEQILPEPQASFLAGLTLGEKRSLPEELTEAFQKTGTTHIVALSGYNISIIASFFMAIFGFLMLGKRWRFWLATLAIVFFTILAGAGASIVRAAIMGVLILIARNQGRMYSVRNALVFAGAVMVFLSPKILRFDVGFQLSFGATAGLVWLAPIFAKWLEKIPKILGLKEILIATLSAQMAVLPLLLIYFGQLALISPLANLAILILIPQTMLVGFLAGGLGAFWLFGGQVLGWLAWLYLTVEIALIKFFAGLPLSSIKIQWGWPAAIIYYLILLAFLYRFHLKQKKNILVEQWAKE